MSFVGAVVAWVFTSERMKAQLVDALGREFQVLAERNGNVDRPIGVTLRGRGCDVDVDAVVQSCRGDHPLCHLKVTRCHDERDGTFVVVDVAWQDAVREVRGLLFVEQLTPRFAIWASDVDPAAARLDRARGREDLCFVLLEPAAARCLVHGRLVVVGPALRGPRAAPRLIEHPIRVQRAPSSSSSFTAEVRCAQAGSGAHPH